jgi:peptide/nickel transport system substrate-binding protein
VNVHLPPRWRALALGATAMAAAAVAGCGGGGHSTTTRSAVQATTAPSSRPAAIPRRGGAVIFGQEFAPDCLNTLLTDCSSTYAARIVSQGNVLENMLTANQEGRYVPLLATHIPTGGDVRLRHGVLSVTWSIEPAATWSDGAPVTSKDVIFTWRTIMNPRNSIASRTGWRDVASIRAPGPKRFTVTFRRGRSYAPWKDMFSLSGGNALLPQHVLKGEDFNTVWNNGGFDTKVPFIGSGPFLLKSYDGGQTARIVANRHYWGRKAGRGGPYLDSITFDSGIGTTGVIVQIKSGELNMVSPLPTFALLAQLNGIRGVGVQQVPGFAFEHIALNAKRPPFDDVRVRQAFAYALDRDGVTKGLLNGKVQTLQSMLGANVFGYVPAFAKYTYDPGMAKRILQADGWTLGRDGVFAKHGRRLTVKVLFTPGNTQRETTLTYLASQAQAAGFDIIPEPDPNIFSSSLPKGQFQAAIFTFIGSADPSQSALLDARQIPTPKNRYSGQNYYRYAGASSLADRSDYAIQDPGSTPPSEPSGGPRRVALLEAMQEKVAADVPFVPLYQPPNTEAYKSTLEGVKANPTQIDPFWNTWGWFFKGGKA